MAVDKSASIMACSNKFSVPYFLPVLLFGCVKTDSLDFDDGDVHDLIQ